MNLTIINYSMRRDSLVFSHQRDVVEALAKFYNSISVFTAEPLDEKVSENLEIVVVPWKNNSNFFNTVRILKVIVPHLLKNRSQTVFTHMSDVHAAIVSPITRLLKIRHILWYAHARNSPYLVWSSFFVSQIVSSTPGSCNLKFNRHKIKFINQGIDPSSFPFRTRINRDLNSFLYYGRLDPSKNIQDLMRTFQTLHSEGSINKLGIFGRPMNQDSQKYIESLKSDFHSLITAGSIKFGGEINRREIFKVAKDYDFFINLYSGSLDKTLVESTFMGLPVVTWNLEYCEQFGTWSKKPAYASTAFVVQEINHIKELTQRELQAELNRRYQYAILNHSLSSWLTRLREVLENRPL